MNSGRKISFRLHEPGMRLHETEIQSPRWNTAKRTRGEAEEGMKTRHHPIRSAQGTRQLRPDALREDSRRDGEEGGSMRSGSLGKVWLLFSLRAASQNEAGSARSCSSGCSSEYWRSSNDNRNTQPPRPGNPSAGPFISEDCALVTE